MPRRRTRYKTLEDSLAYQSKEKALSPNAVLELGENERDSYLRAERKRVSSRYRLHSLGLGSLQVLAGVIAFLIFYLVPFAGGTYEVCAHVEWSVPGATNLNNHKLPCFEILPVLYAALILRGLVYHFPVAVKSHLSKRVGSILKKGNNSTRWIARGFVDFLFSTTAIYATGVRNMETLLAISFLLLAVELLHWSAERDTQHAYSMKKKMVILKKSSKVSLFASTFLAGFIALYFIVHWFLYLSADASSANLFVWLYAVPYILYYMAFNIWFALALNKRSAFYKWKMKLQYAWDVYETLTLIVLVTLASIGAIAQHF